MTFQQTVKSSIIYSSNPKSIAIGDLNNDQRIDIVVANSGTDTIGIFLGIDNGTLFTNQQIYSTGPLSQPTSIAISDFNNDQHTDIAVANFGTNNIAIFFGDSTGTYRNQTIASTNSFRPWFISFADLNRNNYSDLAVVFYATDNIGIFLNDKNGSFNKLIIYSTGYDSFPYSIAIHDLNDDKYVDLVVANYGTDNIAILFNNGNGSFLNPILYSTTSNSNPTSIVIGDLNNDKYFDIIVANSNQQNIGIFMNYGNGTFEQQRTVEITANSINMGYFDDDKNIDIVIIDSIHDQIHILLGSGNGSFSRLTTYDSITGSNPTISIVYDFDKDNQSDLAIVNYGTNNVLLLSKYFSEPSVRASTYFIGRSSRPTSVVIYDFNNDGEYDLVVNNFNDNYVVIFYGMKDGSFVRGNSYSTGENSSPRNIDFADFNHDNRMDLVVANIGTDGISVLLGQDNGTFAPMIPYIVNVGAKPSFVATGDLNNDTHVDIIVANSGFQTITIWFGVGDGSFINDTTYTTGANCLIKMITIGDLNNDQCLDIVFVNEIADIPGVLLGFCNGTFQLITKFETKISDYAFGITLGHFNDDSYLDCAIVCVDGAVMRVFLGNGDGTFQKGVIYSVADIGRPYYVRAVDFNNDHHIDLVLTITTASDIMIFFGDGHGNFEVGRMYPLIYGTNPYGLALADLDHDDQLDIIVTYWGTGYVSVLSPYDAARFSYQQTYSTGSAPYPYSLAVGDFNHDNYTDVVLANSGTDNLSIRFGFDNATFSNQTLYSIGTDSFPQYVITGDIDRDKNLDIIVVNSKSNTMSLIYGHGNGSFAEQMIYSTGDHSNPYSVVMSDINNDNRYDFITANKGTDNIGVFLGFDYTTFLNINNYSIVNQTTPCSVAVDDFNNDKILDLAVIYLTTNTLIIYLGQGNGSFSVLTSYSTGKDSNPNMILTEDLNNDHQPDLVIANFVTNSLTIFLGRGNGSFEFLTTQSTGENARTYALATGDLNNDHIVDIVSANYGSSSVSIFLGYGNGSFAPMILLSTGDFSNTTGIALGDLNNDDYLDIAVANYGASNVGIFLGNGDGSFQKQVTYSTCNQCWAYFITLNDFNQDKILDIAVTTYNTEYINIFFGYGNGSFSSHVIYSTGDGSSPTFHSVGDFNNDDLLDIIVPNSATDGVVILYGSVNGTFVIGKVYSTGKGSFPQQVNIGDFNNDKQLDFVVVNYQSNDIQIFLGHGREPFSGLKKLNTGDGSQPHSVAVDDFNRDGLMDIVVTNYGTDNIGIFLGSGNGDFHSMTTYSTGSNSGTYSVATCDFNSDNKSDIVVTNSQSNTIRIFLGLGDGRFTFGLTYSTGNRAVPRSVAISDFNNDRKYDIAIANAGINNILIFYGNGNGTFTNETSYSLGYNYLPYSLAVSDLNKDQWMDIVIACYQTDNIETLVKMC